jgi:hypothetical protein
MADVKHDTKYYVKLPGHRVYLKEIDGLHIEFAKFFENAVPATKERAIEIAREYRFEAVEIVTTTTTETRERIIFGEVEK